MTESSPSPGIRASLNEAGELVLTAMNAPPEAVIRMDVNADSPRMLCTQGRYLAPVQAPPARASASACSGESAALRPRKPSSCPELLPPRPYPPR